MDSVLTLDRPHARFLVADSDMDWLSYYLFKDRKETLKVFKENFAMLDAQISSLKTDADLEKDSQDNRAWQAEFQSFKNEIAKTLAKQNEAISKLSDSAELGREVSNIEEIPDELHSEDYLAEEAFSPEEEPSFEKKTHTEVEFDRNKEYAKESREVLVKVVHDEGDVIPSIEEANENTYQGKEHEELHPEVTQETFAKAESIEEGFEGNHVKVVSNKNKPVEENHTDGNGIFLLDSAGNSISEREGYPELSEETNKSSELEIELLGGKENIEDSEKIPSEEVNINGK